MRTMRYRFSDYGPWRQIALLDQDDPWRVAERLKRAHGKLEIGWEIEIPASRITVNGRSVESAGAPDFDSIGEEGWRRLEESRRRAVEAQVAAGFMSASEARAGADGGLFVPPELARAVWDHVHGKPAPRPTKGLGSSRRNAMLKRLIYLALIVAAVGYLPVPETIAALSTARDSIQSAVGFQIPAWAGGASLLVAALLGMAGRRVYREATAKRREQADRSHEYRLREEIGAEIRSEAEMSLRARRNGLRKNAFAWVTSLTEGIANARNNGDASVTLAVDGLASEAAEALANTVARVMRVRREGPLVVCAGGGYAQTFAWDREPSEARVQNDPSRDRLPGEPVYGDVGRWITYGEAQRKYGADVIHRCADVCRFRKGGYNAEYAENDIRANLDMPPLIDSEAA